MAGATALLTRLPVPRPDPESTGAAAFPVVGAALGAVAAVPLLLLPARDAPLATVLVVAILALLDGALHLDGLADSADALVARDRAASERARTDPRIGAAGAVALVLVLVLDVASIALVASANRPSAVLSVVVAAAVGRAVPPLLAPWIARRPSGFGSWFAAGTSPASAAAAGLAALAIGALACVASGTIAPAISGLTGLIVGAAALAALAQAQGGATGDAYGAAIELGFAASVMSAAILRA